MTTKRESLNERCARLNRKYGPVTMADVVRELSIEPFKSHYASDLIRRPGGNRGIDGSVQAISNALRHAEAHGVVRREIVGPGNTSVWQVRETSRVKDADQA